jgi:DUF4097 and DUF4098 domain-containing protein YvlB
MQTRGQWIRTAVALGLMVTAMGAFAKDQLTEEINRTFKLAADGRLSLENVNGDVKIEAWDQAEVSLKAVKRGETKEAMDAVSIEIDAKDDRLSVKTKLPQGKKKKKGDSVQVEYSLTVPRGVSLQQVSLVNGNLAIEGVTGKIEASTVNGNLKARSLKNKAKLSSVNGRVDAGFAELPDDGDVKLNTVNGGLKLGLPAKPNAHISASTVNGGIRNEYDLPVKKNFPIGRELHAHLGEGGADIELSSVNGGIEIVHAKAN